MWKTLPSLPITLYRSNKANAGEDGTHAIDKSAIQNIAKKPGSQASSYTRSEMFRAIVNDDESFRQLQRDLRRARVHTNTGVATLLHQPAFAEKMAKRVMDMDAQSKSKANKKNMNARPATSQGGARGASFGDSAQETLKSSWTYAKDSLPISVGVPSVPLTAASLQGLFTFPAPALRQCYTSGSGHAAAAGGSRSSCLVNDLRNMSPKTTAALNRSTTTGVNSNRTLPAHQQGEEELRRSRHCSLRNFFPAANTRHSSLPGSQNIFPDEDQPTLSFVRNTTNRYTLSSEKEDRCEPSSQSSFPSTSSTILKSKEDLMESWNIIFLSDFPDTADEDQLLVDWSCKSSKTRLTDIDVKNQKSNCFAAEPQLVKRKSPARENRSRISKMSRAA
jgi:hypothetical protein